MISFIIFEQNDYMRDLYIKVVKKFLYTALDFYKIYEYSEYNLLTKSKLNKIGGKKIYIINSELTGKNGFDLAKEIRDGGDTLSSIIMIIPKNKVYSIKRVSYTLVLDIITQNERLVKNLLKSIETAYRIATQYSVLTFSFFDEVYRIPYEDIYYISKNFRDDTITVYTKDDTFTHYMTIKKMAKKLSDDPRFFRCHRSCIVNVFKISTYNCKDNIIEFDNGMTVNLVSRDQKQVLVGRIKQNLVEDKLTQQ